MKNHVLELERSNRLPAAAQQAVSAGLTRDNVEIIAVYIDGVVGGVYPTPSNIQKMNLALEFFIEGLLESEQEDVLAEIQGTSTWSIQDAITAAFRNRESQRYALAS